MAQKGSKNWRYKHGLSSHPLYTRFITAKQRCTNPNNPDYKTYKGRWGKNTYVELTQHYLKEYERFVKKCPHLTPSIDRISEDGKYEIGNIKIRDIGENVKKCLRIKGHPMDGRFGKDHHNSKPVEALIDGEWVRFAGAAEAEREMGINDSHIVATCKGKLKTAGGYKWRYAKKTGRS